MRPAPEIRIALAGLGTVGSAVVRLLQEGHDRYLKETGASLRLTSIFDRSYRRKDLEWIGNTVRFTDNLSEFLETPADIVVELIGGSDAAEKIVSHGLKSRKAVVTANKLLMARCGEQYVALAAKQGAYLGFEASVAGGIPIIRVLQRSLIADRIVRLRGILNGTCNFILSEMAESGRNFEEVLGQAQALGYAEADPSLDVSGRDTRDKLAILSALSFGRWISADQIPTLGISEISPVDFLYARKLNATIKLLGIAQSSGSCLLLRVSPFLVPNNLPLSKISGVYNAVEVTGAMVGPTVFSGRGAGGNPTAVSVVADILNAAVTLRQGPPPATDSKVKLPPGEVTLSNKPDSSECFPFYIRFFVNDKPGIIAALSGILARHEINIDSVIQESWPERGNMPFIVTVESTLFTTMQQALQEMGELTFNNLPPLAFPILENLSSHHKM